MTKYNISSPQLEEMDRQQSCNNHSKIDIKNNTENLEQHKDDLNDDASKENKNHAAEEIEHEKLLRNSDNRVESINTGFLLIAFILRHYSRQLYCLKNNVYKKFACVFVCLFVFLSVCLSVVDLTVCLYVCLYECVSVCFSLSLCMSVCLYICLHVYLSVCVNL